MYFCDCLNAMNIFTYLIIIIVSSVTGGVSDSKGVDITYTDSYVLL